MAEDEDENHGEDDVRRRKTFSPPPEGAAFPERLGELTEEDAQRAKAASEAAAAQSSAVSTAPDDNSTVSAYLAQPQMREPASTPVGSPPASGIPAAPVRSSLDDQEIMSKFRDGDIASTEEMMGALESQLALRVSEDERFAAWESGVRYVLPGDEADQLVEASRRAFDGLPPLPTPTPTPTPTPAPQSEPVAPATAENPLLAAIASDTGAMDQPMTGDPDGVDVVASTGFDDVIEDADAVSPPTSQWPLVVTVPEEPLEEAVATAAQASETEAIVLPTLVTSEVSVGTETVSIAHGIDTQETATEALSPNAVDKERWFSFDRVGIEPANDSNRTAGALQLFWTWWAAAIPFVGIVIGAWLIATGNSFLQAVIATVSGVVVGSIPLLVGTVVGIRSGLPALISSRAAFGIAGNIVPSALILLVRLVVAAALIWGAVWTASGIYVEANLWRLDPLILDTILTTFAVIITGALVMAGRRIVILTVWVSAGLSLLAAGALIFITWDVPNRASLSGASGDAAAVVSGATLIAALLMTLWAQSGADVARFAQPGSVAGRTGLVSVAAVIPPIVFIGWGAVLGGSGTEWSSGLLSDPFGTVLSLAPAWYPIPALILLAIPLLGLGSLALHSSSYAVMSLGFAITRYAAAAAVTVVTAVLVFTVLVLVGDPTPFLEDAVRFLGVVVAAWVGIFVAEVVTRRVPLNSAALLGTTGALPAVRVAPLLGFVVAIGAGWGITATVSPMLAWVGYLTPVLGDIGLPDVGPWQLGVPLALVVSLLVGALAGIRGGVVTSSSPVVR